MENMKQRVPTMSRRRPYVLVGIFVVLGLLVVDILFHVTLLTKGHHVVGDSQRVRFKRSADSSTTSGPENLNQTPVPSGAVFTRWGRLDCPPGAALVYKGVMGSGHIEHTGGSAEYLCVTEDPEWLSTIDLTTQPRSHVYGVEFQDNALGLAVGQNGVCAVCQSQRDNYLMIPGRISCVEGWTREFYGYLMSSDYREKSGRNYVCVDKDAVGDRAGFSTDGGGKLSHALSVCGSLPCPKYYNYPPFTCVVCSR